MKPDALRETGTLYFLGWVWDEQVRKAKTVRVDSGESGGAVR